MSGVAILRHERLFVTHMTRRLVPGGLHVIIIPRRMLADEELARHLLGRYERLLVFAYPNSNFDQVVIFAAKKAAYTHPTRVQVEGAADSGRSRGVLDRPVCR